ncbi:MAG: hypothetical protein EOO10_00455 [Chitinophagaceae bacterium]|nr:MAG: hypothetical protein EOO10_00455 [Chitinophagaceae bacterium]
MKRFAATMVMALSVIALLTMQGCMKDSCKRTYTLYKPIYKSLTQVRADMKSTAPQGLQNTGKLNVFGNYIFLNEVGKGIHVIDNANPSSPKNIAFITIPNNVDLAVRGSYLYADSYSDIIVFDISNPVNIKPVKFMDNVMKEKNVYWNPSSTNSDLVQVVVGYTEKDTTVDCNYMLSSCSSCDALAMSSAGTSSFYAAAPQAGTGGSMSSFTIVNDYLYAVSAASLYSISLANPQDPQQTAVRNMGWGIETIYPFQNKLFIGSRNGMFIYDLGNPANPAQQGQFRHATSCDPVIADGQYAYVTLRNGTACNTTLNELNILDISNMSSPQLKARHNLTNPHGLAKDGNTLIICDGKDGLKIYNASAPLNLQLVKKVEGLETYDVIAMNNRAIVVAKDGLYQYDYSNPANPALLSKLAVTKN